MVDEQVATAIFDDYVTGGNQVTAEATPGAPPTAPVAPAQVQAMQPRNEAGQFVTKEGGDGQVEHEVTPQSTSPTEGTSGGHEAAARALGWKPLDEFSGDPRKWVEARVWVENAPLVSQIKSYKQQVREKNKAIEAAQQHYGRVHEAAYQRAIQELSAQKDQAIIEQDRDKVYEVERQMAQVNSERARAPIQGPLYDPAYTEWIDANPTIVGDPQLKAFAVAYEQTLMASDPDIESRLDKTTQAVRAAYPDRFKNGRRQSPSMVESNMGGAAPVNGSGKKFGVSDLSNEERSVMKDLVSGGVLSQDQYLKDIQETRTGSYTFD